MKSFEVERQQTNVQALDSDIREALGATFLGLSTQEGKVILHFAEDVSGTQMKLARDKAVLHDPDILSASQEAELARQQNIVTSRERMKTSLDVAEFASETSMVKTLVERVAWLEAEVRDLRGL